MQSELWTTPAIPKKAAILHVFSGNGAEIPARETIAWSVLTSGILWGGLFWRGRMYFGCRRLGGSRGFGGSGRADGFRRRYEVGGGQDGQAAFAARESGLTAN